MKTDTQILNERVANIIQNLDTNLHQLVRLKELDTNEYLKLISDCVKGALEAYHDEKVCLINEINDTLLKLRELRFNYDTLLSNIELYKQGIIEH